MAVKRLSDDENRFVDNSVEAAVRIGLLFALVVWCFNILQPFLMFIMWGIIVSVASYPIFLWVKEKLGGRNTMASVLLTTLALIFLLVPFFLLGTSLYDGMTILVNDMQSGRLTVPPPGPGVEDWPVIGERLYPAWVLVSEDLEEALLEYGPQLTQVGNVLAEKMKSAGLGLIQFIGSIILAGVLHAQANSSVKLIEDLAVRLAGDAGLTYSRLSCKLISSVTVGILGVAVIQAVLAGLGFMVVGVPAAGVWAFFVLFMGIVQIGPMLLILPIGIYMLGELETLPGIIFLIWCVAVGFLDNVLKPILLARGLDAPMIVIFLGAIGGFITAGFIGLFVGAIVLVLGWVLLMAWIHGDSEEFAEDVLEEIESQGSSE